LMIDTGMTVSTTPVSRNPAWGNSFASSARLARRGSKRIGLRVNIFE